jgi:hypothetical protein
MVIWTLLGVGLGSAITNQVAVIVTLLAFTQFVEPLLRMGLGALWGGRFSTVGSFLPGAAGEAIAGSSIYSALGGGVTLLSWWQGLIVLLGYVVVFAVIGRLTTFRRDIT